MDGNVRSPFGACRGGGPDGQPGAGGWQEITQLSLAIHGGGRKSDAMPLPRKTDRRSTMFSSLLALVGWLLIVIGPPLGAATPMIPIGFVIFGVGVGLVVKHSPRGRRIIRRCSAWCEPRMPWVYSKMPRKLKAALSGKDNRTL